VDSSATPVPAGLIKFRLECSMFYVDVRLREFNGRWIASADTPAGPSLGIGPNAERAIQGALEPFGLAADELIASMSRNARR
jgi:hypothetical protein